MCWSHSPLPSSCLFLAPVLTDPSWKDLFAVGLLNILITQPDRSFLLFPFFRDSKISMENHTSRHTVAIHFASAAPTSPLLASKRCLEKKGRLWGRFIKSGSLSPGLSFPSCHPWPWMRGWGAGPCIASWFIGIESPACQARWKCWCSQGGSDFSLVGVISSHSECYKSGVITVEIYHCIWEAVHSPFFLICESDWALFTISTIIV